VSTPVSLEAGTAIDGRYVLEAQLGEGSFGTVWRAKDQRLAGRLVAIKFLKPECLSSTEVVKRFEAEAAALAQVVHPNVVGVIDRGESQGHRYIVTELVEGRSLAAWLDAFRASGQQPDPAAVRRLFDQVCAAIEAAHAVRAPGPIVHRDIKPDNVLLRTLPSGEVVVKVADFGVARLGARRGTSTGMLLGTPLYMSPEQALGMADDIGPWTDVFSLGVMLVEMLTLQVQTGPGGYWWNVVQNRDEAAVRGLLETLRPDVPPGAWEVAARAMRPVRIERYPDAGALRQALEGRWPVAGAGRVPVSAVAPTIDSMPAVAASPADPQATLRAGRPVAAPAALPVTLQEGPSVAPAGQPSPVVPAPAAPAPAALPGTVAQPAPRRQDLRGLVVGAGVGLALLALAWGGYALWGSPGTDRQWRRDTVDAGAVRPTPVLVAVPDVPAPTPLPVAAVDAGVRVTPHRTTTTATHRTTTPAVAPTHPATTPAPRPVATPRTPPVLAPPPAGPVAPPPGPVAPTDPAGRGRRGGVFRRMLQGLNPNAGTQPPVEPRIR
jgi:hypothetical protein